jgi:hypothetical protein
LKSEGFGALLATADAVLRRRAEWMAGARHAPGMVDALVAAELLRPGTREALQLHYGAAMPALRKRQLEGGAPAFVARLRLSRMPRLREALDRLFAAVSGAKLSCAACLGAATPRELVEDRTLAEVYAGCHFGGAMPMLYASPADLVAVAGDPLEVIDARLVGPLVHELSHFRAEDPPAPANVHEALAAFIGSEVWPAQVWPERALDGIPGAAYFAAVGGWIARAVGETGALRIQAGVLDLRDALGPRCSEALRCYGFLPFLETGAPHLLSDAFHPGRWWKLIDLHRDDARAQDFAERFVDPLLAGAPASVRSWDDALDALPWQELPAFRDPPGALDRKLALLAERALRVRARRSGASFEAVCADPPGELSLDPAACEMRAPWPGPDAIGAPPSFPWPPALRTTPSTTLQAWRAFS